MIRSIDFRFFKPICLVLCLLLALSPLGCQTHPAPPVETTGEETQKRYCENEEINAILNDSGFRDQPRIEDIEITRYPEEEFLSNNHCFAFNRDMNYFLGHSARYDSLGWIVNDYPTQIVRTIEANGEKVMYFVYETDGDTRVFVFFDSSTDYRYTVGFPIIMKRTLEYQDFSALGEGDTMADVAKVDPIAVLYQKEYDRLSDVLVEKLYVNGAEEISTIHLLRDGILRIDYDRVSKGNYVIKAIGYHEDFVLPVLGGWFVGNPCYRIYEFDYVK